MQEQQPPIRRKRKKRNNGLGYLILFTLVFISALFGLSYIVKSYSPDVDVTIGNNDSLTLGEEDMDVEIKTIDERLKWIQMEDEMPTVSVRESSDKNDKKEKTDNDGNNKKNDKNNKKTEHIKEPVKTAKDNNQNLKTEVKTEKNKIQPPKPLPKVVTKVYVGKYTSVEDAMAIQRKIAAEESDIVPFIKSINGSYVVQIGSFTERERANILAGRMKSKGYAIRLINEN